MYSQTAVLPSRNSDVSRVAPVAHTPTLGDLFKVQPASEYRVGEAVIREGDPADHILHVLGGVLRTCKLLPDGRRAIIGFIYPGDVLGVSFQSRYLFTAEAVTNVKFGGLR